MKTYDAGMKEGVPRTGHLYSGLYLAGAFRISASNLAR